MEETLVKKGIFITSESLQSKFMIECLQSLLSVYPGITFTSVVSNADVGGYKVCFEDTEIMTVLEKRFMTVTNKQIPIHPSETYLMIHDLDLNEGNKFEHDLTDTIHEKFGTVLCYDKFPRLKETAINSFLVLVDVPEMKDLDIFSRNGYPQMTISVSAMSKNLKVSFWCRRCRNPGHTFQECFERPSKPLQEQTRSRKESSRNEIQMNSREQPDQCSFDSARQVLNYPGMASILESADSFAIKLGRELAMHQARNVSDEGNSDQKSDGNATDELVSRVADMINFVETAKNNECNTHMKKAKDKSAEIYTSTEIKKEIPDETFHSAKQASKEPQGKIVGTFRTNPRSGTAEYDDNARPFSSDATSTTTDDDIQIIEDDSTNRQETSKDSSTQADHIKKEPITLEQKIPVHNPPVSPLLANMSALQRSLLQPGSSTYSPQQNQMTSFLSDRLHDCINKAYETQRILDRRTLDAFLIHVKKKSNPMQIASKYTDDVEGLKNQLSQILFFYYNTPQTGTKEDTQFIKWLNGLVERFDGTVPRKRKPARKSDEGTPRKRMA